MLIQRNINVNRGWNAFHSVSLCWPQLWPDDVTWIQIKTKRECTQEKRSQGKLTLSSYKIGWCVVLLFTKNRPILNQILSQVICTESKVVVKNAFFREPLGEIWRDKINKMLREILKLMGASHFSFFGGQQLTRYRGTSDLLMCFKSRQALS